MKSATSVVVVDEEAAGESAFAARAVRVARVRERARAVRPQRADAQGSAQAFTSQRALRPAAAPGEVDEAALVAAYAADRVAVARLVQILRPRRGRLAEHGL